MEKTTSYLRNVVSTCHDSCNAQILNIAGQSSRIWSNGGHVSMINLHSVEIPCMYWDSVETSYMAISYTGMESWKQLQIYLGYSKST